MSGAAELPRSSPPPTTFPRSPTMTPIDHIDPFDDIIPPRRVLEITSLVEALSRHAGFTVREERDVERLVTRAYLAGLGDAGQGTFGSLPPGSTPS